jgi:hypothetical protein
VFNGGSGSVFFVTISVLNGVKRRRIRNEPSEIKRRIMKEYRHIFGSRAIYMTIQL